MCSTSGPPKAWSIPNIPFTVLLVKPYFGSEISCDTLRRLDGWLDGRDLHDVTLAAYVAALHDVGFSSASPRRVSARSWLVSPLSLASEPPERWPATGGRPALGARAVAAVRGFGPSRRARHLPPPAAARAGIESKEVPLERGRVDAVIAGLQFMDVMRRSLVSALRWADVVDSTDGDGLLVTVRRSKTNQEGDVNEVRFLKDGVARALQALRTSTSPEPGDRVVPLSAQMIGLRFTAAAEAAGVDSRVAAHSGRVGLASELTSRGASTTDVMLAGNWKTSRMVAHYSAGASAERGAGARYL